MLFTKELVVVIYVSFSIKTLNSKPTCPSQMYYDAVVKRCSPCTDICLNAALQRTEEMCRQECPDFKTAGTLKIFEDSTSFNSLVAVIVGLVIGTVVVVAAIVVILIKKKEIKDFICKVADRNRDLEEVVQEETTVKELFLPENHGGPAPHDGADGNSSNRSGDAERDRIEMVEMVPPSYNKNIAQVSDHIENATYIPTLARQK